MNGVVGADWALRCERLCVDRGWRRVLYDVSFELRAGETLCIIGPNGAGKTTLLLAVLGLLRPARGCVRLDGRAMHELNPRVRGRFAALLPQALEHVPPFTVAELVADGRYAHMPPWSALRDEDHKAVRRALQTCGLEALADRRVDRLSGGERQKALLAAALAQQPRLLVLDEPTTALDPAYRIELVDILRAYHADGGTLLLVSHDLHLPKLLGGRVLALRAGRVAAEAPAEALLRPERLSPLYEAPFRTARTTDGEVLVVPDYWKTDE